MVKLQSANKQMCKQTFDWFIPHHIPGFFFYINLEVFFILSHLSR